MVGNDGEEYVSEGCSVSVLNQCRADLKKYRWKKNKVYWPVDVPYLQHLVASDEETNTKDRPFEPSRDMIVISLRSAIYRKHPCFHQGGSCGAFARRVLEPETVLDRHYCGVLREDNIPGLEKNGYWFECSDLKHAVDALPAGNETRYINHFQSIADCPNVMALPGEDNAAPVAFKVTRRIEVGEEIVLNYGRGYVESFLPTLLGEYNDCCVHILETTQKGDGVTYPEEGDNVSLHFRCYLQINDAVVWDTRHTSMADAGMTVPENLTQPVVFEVGGELPRYVVPGLDLGVRRLSLGQHTRLLVLSDMAWAAEGIPGVVPTHCDVYYDVELLAIGGYAADVAPEGSVSGMSDATPNDEATALPQKRRPESHNASTTPAHDDVDTDLRGEPECVD